MPAVSSSSRRRLRNHPASAATAASSSSAIQPHGVVPEASVEGGVPWPRLEVALGTGVLDSALGLSEVGSGVGSADDVVGSGLSVVGSGLADVLVGLGEADVGVGDADSASVSDALSLGSDSVGSADWVSDTVSEGISDGDSLGGSDVRLGSSLGNESDGVGRVGRSLGSEMLPLPHPVMSPTTSIEPAAAVRSLDRMPHPSPPVGQPADAPTSAHDARPRREPCRVVTWRHRSRRGGWLGRMKALVKAEAAPGLWLLDVPEPPTGPGEVRIRVLRTGICGTDLHVRSWDPWAQGAVRTPVTLGHEIAGRVEEVGTGVDTVDVGDLVSVEGHIVCGRCRWCLGGRRQLCPNTVSVGIDRDGGFAEVVVVPATNVWRHPKPIDPDVAAIFDPFGNAVHSALAFEVLGEDVLVTGAGPIGIMAASVVRHAGARNIVITDLSPERLALAESMGAVTRAIDVRTTNLRDVMAELGMVEGFDVGLEMSGAAPALQSMISTMAHGGHIALLGLPSTSVEFQWDRVIRSMLTVKGIFGREMFETWYAMSVLVGAGLDISPVITHRFPFTEFDEAFDTAASGHCGKVVLDWEVAS